MTDRPLARRELFTGGWAKALIRAALPVTDRIDAAASRFSADVAQADRHPKQPVREIPVHRPPGAVAEKEFLAGCTRCADCIRACPHQAIVVAPARFRQAAGTPMIDPGTSPCLMCVDTPCISACRPGVLNRERPLVMGVAKIAPLDCLAHQGTTCTSCSERCPVPHAIVLDRGRPRIAAEACTGCGVCHHVCPAPRNAVMILPSTRTAHV